MRRDPEELSRVRFDVVVLGAGVLGACVARDAALRGLSTALVERDDFGSGTSANSLKVIHGGLRHLQRLDLREMRASVRERSTWLRIAPHLVAPLPVVVPLFGRGAERAAFRIALAVNDALSADRNRGLSAGRRIAGGRALSRHECLTRVPQLESTGVSGAVLFHDAQMYSSERLVLAVVLSAVEAGAVVANHAECLGPLVEDGTRTGVRVLDRATGSELPLRARVIVNAAGPGGPGLTRRLLGQPTGPPPALSLAWNLVLAGADHQAAFALPGAASTPTGGGGGRPRRLFVVPWRGRTLVGTGHAPFSGEPVAFAGLEPGHPALQAFLDEVNGTWPGAPLSFEDALLIHSGLLPAEPPTTAGPCEPVRLTLRHSITLDGEGGSAILTATTVKFTAARRVAEDAVDRVCRILGHRDAPARTASTPLPGAPAEGVAALLEAARRELSGELAPDVIDHLVRSYGTGYRDVVAWRGEDPRWSERVEPGRPVIRAQLLHGARREMAASVDDLLLRRTEVGARGPVASEVRAEAARILAPSAGGRAAS